MKVKQVFKRYGGDIVTSMSPLKYCPKCGQSFDFMPLKNGYQLECKHCGFILYKNPYPGVVVLIIDDERILLGKRAKNVFEGGKWSLPGGFIEFEENFLSAAHREIMEETGLSIKIRSILSVVSNFFSPELHTIVIVLLAEKKAGEPVPGDDIENLGWFSLAGPFPEMAFEADKEIINRYYKTRIKGIPVDSDFAL